MSTAPLPFAIGYFYGRSRTEKIAEVDLIYRSTADFEAGYGAGERDFQEVDLHEQALDAKQVSE